MATHGGHAVAYSMAFDAGLRIKCLAAGAATLGIVVAISGGRNLINGIICKLRDYRGKSWAEGIEHQLGAKE